MSKKSNLFSTIFFTIIFLVGLSVMLYPAVSNWWNSKVQSRAVASYEKAVTNMENDKSDEMIKQAEDYNQKLTHLNQPYLNYDAIPNYENILNISGTGIMGYITIPVIQIEIPIYHGTSEEVLNIAAGHLQGSAFPVGGINTHSVISAHRGLPSAKLFTDLDELVVGDVFTINVLGRVYTYEVEEILIVLPHEMDKLDIISGGDYVTLMTCTPYGVNTHRLLLRSKRIETDYVSNAKVTSDAVQVDPMLVVPLVASPLVLVLLCFWIFDSRKKKPLPYRNPLYTLKYK